MNVGRSSRATLVTQVRRNLRGVARRWDDLVDQQPLPSPFMKSWWLDNCALGEPIILCFYDGPELVGGAAFESRRLGRWPYRIERITCLGQGVLAPDHIDVIARSQYEDLALRATLAWLHDSPARLVDLDGLASEGRLGRSLAGDVIERTDAPYANLPGSGAEYLANRPGKLRSTVKRSRKRLFSDGAQFRQADSSEMSGAMDRLAELHSARWSDDSQFLDGFERLKRAAVVGARTGDVVINELVAADGHTIATELNLICGRRISFYQAGRRIQREWRGCGSVLRAELIDLACRENLVEYDLLRGDESYKRDWSEDRRELLRCRFGVGAKGRLAASSAKAWRRVEPRVDTTMASIRDQLSRVPWPPRRGSRDELSR